MGSNVTSVVCPVCASEIVRMAHVCSRCRTPHHADCAGFIGRCAVFGCGGAAFEEQSLGAAMLHVPSSEADAPESISVSNTSTKPKLRRGIGGRLVAACRLAMGNPGIFLPLLALSATCNFAFGILAAFVTPQTIQCLLVILLISRAKGKESSLGWAVGALVRRLPRILWNFVIVGLTVGFLMSVGGMLWMAAYSAFGNQQVVAGMVAVALGALVLWKSMDRAAVLQLSQIVAALGTEEEPGNPRDRSEELIGVGYWQAFATFFLFCFGGGMLGGAVGYLKVILLSSHGPFAASASSVPMKAAFDLFGHAVVGAMGLLASTFWMLFYLEARKARQPLDLAFTSPEFVPGPEESAS